MRGYSQEIFLRLVGLVVLLAVGMTGLSVWFVRWQQGTVTQAERSGVFRPVDRTARLQRLRALLDDGPAVAPSPGEGPPLECEPREKAILVLRVMEYRQFAADEANALADRLLAGMGPGVSCAQVLQGVHTVNRIRLANSSNPSDGDQDIAEALVESVNWVPASTCVYQPVAGGYRLAFGPPVACWRQGMQSVLAEASAPDEATRAARQLFAQATRRERQEVSAVDWRLTFHPQVQSLLAGWRQCLEGRAEACPAGLPAGTAAHVSAAVLDEDTGGVLGALCWGGGCESQTLRPLGPLAAGLVEAPPASTFKLVHALALAQRRGQDTLLLQRQIKTSGQVDGLALKRNEWWERQVICDGSATAACTHPSALLDTTTTFMWGGNCAANDVRCGRVSLVLGAGETLAPGFMGRVRLPSVAGRSARMLEWTQYEAVRQGKQRPGADAAYVNTSLTVQSVLGAGDTRTSALGLAALSMQISRLSRGLPPVAPSIVLPITRDGPDKRPPVAGARQRLAGLAVLEGMRKVVQPQEAGWQGAGTAAGAFERHFGRPCTVDCGLAGKTGTVSRQDPVFAGTTLFTGVVEPARLATWRQDPEPGRITRRLTIGVIVMPKPSDPPSGHAAAALAMRLADELSRLKGAP